MFIFFSFFLCYYSIMDYISVVIDSFWEVMTQATTLVVPCIAIMLIFGLIKGLLFHDR